MDANRSNEDHPLASQVGLDLTGVDLGSVVLRRQASFTVEETTYEQDECYFLVHADHVEVDDAGWTDQERRTISTYRWWTPDELAATGETIYPERLTDLLADEL